MGTQYMSVAIKHGDFMISFTTTPSNMDAAYHELSKLKGVFPDDLTALKLLIENVELKLERIHSCIHSGSS